MSKKVKIYYAKPGESGMAFSGTRKTMEKRYQKMRKKILYDGEVYDSRRDLAKAMGLPSCFCFVHALRVGSFQGKPIKSLD